MDSSFLDSPQLSRDFEILQRLLDLCFYYFFLVFDHTFQGFPFSFSDQISLLLVIQTLQSYQLKQTLDGFTLCERTFTHLCLCCQGIFYNMYSNVLDKDLFLTVLYQSRINKIVMSVFPTICRWTLGHFINFMTSRSYMYHCI